MSAFERIVHMTPAFDGRPASKGGCSEWRTPSMKPDDGTPSTNYGVGSVKIMFILKGDKGVVQFLCYTNWYPPHVQKGRHNKPTRYFDMQPLPADRGYHSPVPRYEGQTIVDNNCEWLDGQPCYYDGSSLNADPIRDVLLKEGSDGVWRELEAYYHRVFKEEVE